MLYIRIQNLREADETYNRARVMLKISTEKCPSPCFWHSIVLSLQLLSSSLQHCLFPRSHVSFLYTHRYSGRPATVYG